MITKEVRAHLVTSSNDALAGVKVFPVAAPDNAARPYCVYTLANDYNGDMDGERFARIDIEVYPLSDTASPQYRSAADIAEAVRAQLSAMHGQYAGLCVLNAKHLSTRDTFYRSTNQHGRRVELLFHYLNG